MLTVAFHTERSGDEIWQWERGECYDNKLPLDSIHRVVAWGDELILISKLVQGIPMIDLTLYSEMAWFGDIAKSIVWAIALYADKE